jgi:hypothetical protein
MALLGVTGSVTVVATAMVFVVELALGPEASIGAR